jgi:hypothetical protein
MYDVEPEFDRYKYFGKAIIIELEFSLLYCLRRGKPKNDKGFQYVLQEYIDNREENYNILKEYLDWLKNGNNDLFEEHSNFGINEEESRYSSKRMVNFLESAFEFFDDRRQETILFIPTGKIKPWTPFLDKKP